VNPITWKLYAGGAGGPQSHGPGEDDEEFDEGRSDDELQSVGLGRFEDRELKINGG